jgi:hypothetical protein
MLVFGGFASADDGIATCGTVLDGTADRDSIYVLCPTLTGLSKYDVSSMIKAALQKSPHRGAVIHVIFLRDPAVLDRKNNFQNMEERLASWGSSFVGMYHRNTGFLMYRSSADGGWRNIQLEDV